MKQPTLLIDADYFFYRAASAVEEEHDYDSELSIIIGNFKEGKRIIRCELANLRERFSTNDLILTFTDRTNFRKDIDPSYKGNRTKRKPCGYLRLKNWGLEAYPSIMKPGLEADDVCGIMATNGSLDSFVLISPDKDLEQIPCRIFNLKNEFEQTPEQARKRLFEQCLTGDQTDGYSGCPGVGPKKAEALLKQVKDGNYWPVVVKAYEQAQQTEADALRNLRLCRILQASDWDSAKKKPILYTP